MNLFMAVGGKKKPDADGDYDGDAPERNYDEERMRHASRLVKAVHAHDAEAADDAMRGHYGVCADEHEAMMKKEK